MYRLKRGILLCRAKAFILIRTVLLTCIAAAFRNSALALVNTLWITAQVNCSINTALISADNDYALIRYEPSLTQYYFLSCIQSILCVTLYIITIFLIANFILIKLKEIRILYTCQ